jgi:hypothetical protein
MIQRHVTPPLVLSLLLLATGCQGRPADSAGTQHERDSVLAQSKIPGARAVKRALEVGDSARARVLQEDSVATAP